VGTHEALEDPDLDLVGNEHGDHAADTQIVGRGERESVGRRPRRGGAVAAGEDAHVASRIPQTERLRGSLIAVADDADRGPLQEVRVGVAVAEDAGHSMCYPSPSSARSISSYFMRYLEAFSFSPI
jgi:hypothetical protein